MKTPYKRLKIGSVWKSKRRGNLSMVVALANFSLPEKYAKTNPPQVVFVDDTGIYSTAVDRFLSIKTFVRQDKDIYDSLMSIYSVDLDEDSDDLLEIDDSKQVSVESTGTFVQTLATKAFSAEAPKPVVASVATEFMPSVSVEMLDGNITEAEGFSRYSSLRTIDESYYHTLTFDSIKSVTQLSNSIDNIKSITVSLKKDLKVEIDPQYLTSASTSFEKLSDGSVKYKYNITFAELGEEDLDEDLDDDLEENTEDSYNISPSNLTVTGSSNALDAAMSSILSAAVAGSSTPVVEQNCLEDNKTEEPAVETQQAEVQVVETQAVESEHLDEVSDITEINGFTEAVSQTASEEKTSEIVSDKEDSSVQFEEIEEVTPTLLDGYKDESEEDSEEDLLGSAAFDELDADEEDSDYSMSVDEISDSELLSKHLVMPDDKLIIEENTEALTLADKLENAIRINEQNDKKSEEDALVNSDHNSQEENSGLVEENSEDTSLTEENSEEDISAEAEEEQTEENTESEISELTEEDALSDGVIIDAKEILLNEELAETAAQDQHKEEEA